MILNLHKDDHRKRAEVYFAKLIEQCAKIELKKIPQKRSLSQNAYLHVLFALWGSEYGYTIEEAKIVVKRLLNYTYEKNGQMFLVHTSEMNTKELTEFIDRYRNFSANEGLYLPSADEIGDNYADYAFDIDRAEIMQKRYGI